MNDPKSQTDVPLISIVMPVYNGESYLEQTLESIDSQTCSDYELICVDDGSQDASLAILTRHASEDSRIKVIEGSHAGGGAARNLGMAHARGTYIIFLDSDDFFEPTLLEHASARMTETNADIVIFDAMTYNNRTQTVNTKRHFLYQWLMNTLRLSDRVFNRTDAPFDISRIITPAPWLKLYRRQFLEDENLRFQEIDNSNDFLFGQLSLICAQRIAILNEQLVRYSTNNPSGTQTNKSEKPTCILQAIDGLRQELVKRSLYHEVEQCFVATANKALSYSLTSLRPISRDILLDALLDGKLECLEALGHERAWYHHKSSYDNYHLITAAMEERRIRRQIEAAPELAMSPAIGKDSPLVSVVLTIHNGAAHLEESLRSVLDQSMEDLEVVCIDDGSSDESPALIDELATRDERVRVVHQAHKGLSCARNAGTAAAHGRYLTFLDCGDVLLPNALEHAVQCAQDGAREVVLFDVDPFTSTGDDVSAADAARFRRHGRYGDQYTGAELMVSMRRVGDYQPHAYAQLFDRTYLESIGLSFIPAIPSADLAFSFCALLQSPRAHYLSEPLYRHCVSVEEYEFADQPFTQSYGAYASYCAMAHLLEAQQAHLTPDYYEVLTNLVFDRISEARKRYLELPSEERGRVYALGKNYAGFQRLVATPAELDERVKEHASQIKELTSEKKTLSDEVATLRQQLEEERVLKERALEEANRLRQSRTYQLGAAVLKPYRVATRLLKERKSKH